MPVVPANLPNKAAAAEAGEERGMAKGNTPSKTRPGHRAGHGALSALDRVRQVARQDKEMRFTALLHHVDLDRLRAAYWAIRPAAAPGVDGVRWDAYGQELEGNLRDLHRRVHSGAYQVHLYNLLPTWRVIGLDTALFVSAFGEQHEGHTSPMYKITGSPHGALHRGFLRFLGELRRTSRQVI